MTRQVRFLPIFYEKLLGKIGLVGQFDNFARKSLVKPKKFFWLGAWWLKLTILMNKILNMDERGTKTRTAEKLQSKQRSRAYNER